MAQKKQQKKTPAKGKPQNKGLSQAQIRQKQFAIRNARAGFDELLRGWGIPITPAVAQFVAQAAQKGMSGDAFMAAIRKTKAYARQFPGIMQPNGTLRMSEAEYISGFEALRDYGASIGQQMDRGEFAMALKNGNSISEIKQKFGATDSLQRNNSQLEAFAEYAREMGLKEPPKTREDLLKFVMGMGPREWEMAYDTAHVMSKARNAGLSLSVQETKDLINKIETSGIADAVDITPETFAKVADNIRHVGTMKQYGIDDKDAIMAAFGMGPRRQLVDDVIRNAERLGSGEGLVEEDPFAEASADRFTQGERRRGGASL